MHSPASATNAEPVITLIPAFLFVLFARLQIDVIAQGIEDNAQCQWLKSHGVHQSQGYYLGPPRVQVVF